MPERLGGVLEARALGERVVRGLHELGALSEGEFGGLRALVVLDDFGAHLREGRVFRREAFLERDEIHAVGPRQHLAERLLGGELERGASEVARCVGQLGPLELGERLGDLHGQAPLRGEREQAGGFVFLFEQLVGELAGLFLADAHCEVVAELGPNLGHGLHEGHRYVVGIFEAEDVGRVIRLHDGAEVGVRGQLLVRLGVVVRVRKVNVVDEGARGDAVGGEVVRVVGAQRGVVELHLGEAVRAGEEDELGERLLVLATVESIRALGGDELAGEAEHPRELLAAQLILQIPLETRLGHTARRQPLFGESVILLEVEDAGLRIAEGVLDVLHQRVLPYFDAFLADVMVDEEPLPGLPIEVVTIHHGLLWRGPLAGVQEEKQLRIGVSLREVVALDGLPVKCAVVLLAAALSRADVRAEEEDEGDDHHRDDDAPEPLRVSA